MLLFVQAQNEPSARIHSFLMTNSLRQFKSQVLTNLSKVELFSSVHCYEKNSLVWKSQHCKNLFSASFSLSVVFFRFPCDAEIICKLNFKHLKYFVKFYTNLNSSHPDFMTLFPTFLSPMKLQDPRIKI